MLRLWIDTQFNSDDDVATLRCAIAHVGIEIVGISVVGPDAPDRAVAVRDFFATTRHSAPLIYAGPPDPRALDMAEAILAIGPLTNLAMLLRAGIELPPMSVTGAFLAGTESGVVVAETMFGMDPLSAALVIAETADLLVAPMHLVEDVTAGQLSLLALVGEAVQIEKRKIAVTVEGLLAVHDRDGKEHDLVVWADTAAAVRRVSNLLENFGVTEGTRTPGLRDHNPTL